MKTTLKQIRAAGPCGLHLTEDGERTGYLKLKHYFGKGYGDNTPISIATVIDSNGLDDALWCLLAVKGHQREMRLFAVWCARRVEPLMADERSAMVGAFVERHANGVATDAELVAARRAAWDSAWEAAMDSVMGAAMGTVWDTAWDAARGAARDAALGTAMGTAWDSAMGTAGDAAMGTAMEAAGDAAWDAVRGGATDGELVAARDAAWDAAWDAARGAQADELRRVCACIEAGDDPYPLSGVQLIDEVAA